MIYIDTGAFLARHLSKDQHHFQAKDYWRVIKKRNEACATSNFVLDETFTLMGRCAGYNFAAQRARNIYASESIQILRPTKEEELKAIDLFEKYSDHRLSFTDCISFVLMKTEKIKRVFTFDHHFQFLGFQTFPKVNNKI
jgi:predicted nucleic acid-binding protein